jgi:hypothetical protein
VNNATPHNFSTSSRLALALALAALACTGAVRVATAGDLPQGPGIFPASASPAAVAATYFGTNLIVNPDAESGSPSPDGLISVDAPGWSRNGTGATVLKWAAASGNDPAYTDPGPAVRGVSLFVGGSNVAASEYTQSMNLAAIARMIDMHAVDFHLAGYLGGWTSQDDNAKLSVRFLNASSATIDSTLIGPVLAIDRGNATALLYRSTTGTLPVGTRSVVFTLWFTRVSGSYNDGYADSLGFTLSTNQTADVPAGNGSDLRLSLSPNPAPTAASIAYSLPQSGNVRLEVLDVSGRRVALLADGEQVAGAHTLRWAPSGARGAGLYFVRLTTRNGVSTSKLAVVNR